MAFREKLLYRDVFLVNIRYTGGTKCWEEFDRTIEKWEHNKHEVTQRAIRS